MKFGLDINTVNAMCDIFNKYPQVEEVTLYGSRANGTYREGSDIDLTLKGIDLTEAVRGNIAIDLDELDTPYLIDLSIYGNLKQQLVEHIERSGKVFYRQDDFSRK